MTISSKWGYVYTADWEVAADPPEVKHHDVDTFRRQLSETREHLGDWLALYQIHSATPDSGVLGERRGAERDGRVRPPARRQRQRHEPGRDDRSRGVARASSAPCRRPGTCTSARPRMRWRARGLKVIVKEALANGRLAARDAEALARRWRSRGPPWCSAARRRWTSCVQPARARDAAAGRSPRAGRGQARLLGAARTTGVELSAADVQLAEDPLAQRVAAAGARPRAPRAPRSARRRATPRARRAPGAPRSRAPRAGTASRTARS